VENAVIAGLDVGTTATKAVAFRVGSPERQIVMREYPLLQPAPEQEVQDPDAMVDAVVDALDELAPEAVALGTAMHGLIGLDADKRPLTPLLTWADGRATAQARALRDRAGELLARTGTPVHPMSPLVKIRWFTECEPETAARVRWWVGLKDYLVHRLTGELVTEFSSASATGLLDLATLEWDEEAVALAGTTVDRLPPVRSPWDVLRLPDGTPVVLGAADGPLGNLGTGALAPGVASVSLGTSGAVRMVVGSPRSDPSGALFCYALTEDAFVLGGAISNGGIVVRWAGEALDVAGDEAVLSLAASVPPGSDGLVMLPYLMSERAPLWAPEIPGAVLGLRRRHTRAHLVRAAIEGVCLQLATILTRLDALEPVTEVRITGGAFRSALWREVLAAVLNRPLVATGDAEGTARGAAALGLVALDLAPDLESALELLPGPAERSVIEPDPALVEAYAGAGERVAELIAGLGPVAGAMRPGA
jgi:gluconokinase